MWTLYPGVRVCASRTRALLYKPASGSAGIFACAATLLGGRGGFIGKVGRDSLSRMVAGTLRGQGVDLSRLIVSDEGQMGLAFLEYLPEGRNYQYYRKNSVGSLLRASELDAEYISGAYAVHFPGMLLELTEEMRGACERLVEIAREKGILVSFDPNIRRELSADAAARARLLWAVRHADVVAPTLSEGQMITGETSIGDVLRALHAMGPRDVALTRDKDGAVLSRGGEVAVAAGIDEEPVDPHGRGRYACRGTVRRPAGGYVPGTAGGVLQLCGHAGHQEKRRHRDGAARTRTGGRDGGLRRVPCGMHAAGKPGMTARESEPAAYRRKAYRARGGGGGRGMPVR